MYRTLVNAGNQGNARNWKYDPWDHLGKGMLPGHSPPDKVVSTWFMRSDTVGVMFINFLSYIILWGHLFVNFLHYIRFLGHALVNFLLYVIKIYIPEL